MKKMNKPWRTRAMYIGTRCFEKNEMHKKLKMYGDVTIAAKYKKKKKKLTNLLRISEKHYYKQLLDNNKNSP